MSGSLGVNDSYASASFAGDKIQRGNKFTKPRTVEIDTKYEGAIKMDIWPGFALLLKNSKDETRVIIGPKSVLLEYDEVPIAIEVSTGQPKGTGGAKRRDVYLNLSANHVTDIVEVETSDFVKIKIKLSYRINFIGEEHDKWWTVKNYVKLLCDHMRSRLKQKAKSHGIEYFYSSVIDLVRSTILSNEGSFTFSENNMQIYDVEILNVNIEDDIIRASLQNIQANTMQVVLAKKALTLQQDGDEAKLEYTDHMSILRHDSHMESLKRREIREEEESRLSHEAKTEAEKSKAELAQMDRETKAIFNTTAAEAFNEDHRQKMEMQSANMEFIKAKSDANVAQLSIISDKLGAAIIHVSNNKALGELADAFGDVAVFEKDGLIETSKTLLGPAVNHLIESVKED